MSKIKLPSSDEIKEQLKWLRENKEKIPRHTKFGDSNWDKIDVQITVLEEDLTEEDIYSKSCEYDEDPEELGVDWNFNQRDAALDARGYLDGKEISPSENWKPLIPKE